MFSLRIRRYLVLSAYVAAVAVLSLLSEMFSLFVALLFWPRFRLWLYRLFFSRADCSTCGKAIPLVGSWRCGNCGFVQHRHAFKPCARCRTGIGELPCPHCAHGMFL